MRYLILSILVTGCSPAGVYTPAHIKSVDDFNLACEKNCQPKKNDKLPYDIFFNTNFQICRCIAGE